MDKWEEPLQFLIITDDPSTLGWMQAFAANEINQRFEIIVYASHQDLTPLAYPDPKP